MEKPVLLLISDRSSVLLKQLRGSKVAMVRPCFSPSALRTLKTAARALYIARKRQHTDDGGAAYHLQEVPDEAEALPVRSPGIRSSGKILRRF